MDIELKDINRITSIIKTKYGYDFGDYALSSFKRRIRRIMDLQNVKSIDSIIHKLETDKFYFKDFLSEITVNVTEMFRDPTFWIALKDEVLLPLFKNRDEITIWHAGCSSGEEVYSMAILLDSIGKLKNAKIFATDIDEKILLQAKSKGYSSKNMETNASNFNEIYPDKEIFDFFQKSDDTFSVKSFLNENIIFKKHNLVSDDAFSKFDIVLCRNVLIYFNQKLQNEVLKKMTLGLFDNGVLCIGSKESLIWCEDINLYQEINKEEKIFKKKGS